MAAFFYQQHHLPFLLDPPYLPETPIEVLLQPDHTGDLSDASCCLPYYCCPSQVIQEVSASPDSQMGHSSVLTEPNLREGVSKTQTSIDKKRKNKDDKGSKCRKQKKSMAGAKACEEPPEGYIHVRARRGQATDSHSLAERVRREKIRLRMKVLQGLVPGCDKVTGKALMLDEIINYVQSLQNQVEFLSMKLASMNPLLYEFGVDINDIMDLPEPLPTAQQASHTQPITMEETRTINYPMMNTPQGATAFSDQENGGFLKQVGGQGQGFLSQDEFNNMCSLQYSLMKSADKHML